MVEHGTGPAAASLVKKLRQVWTQREAQNVIRAMATKRERTTRLIVDCLLLLLWSKTVEEMTARLAAVCILDIFFTMRRHDAFAGISVT